eukprot:CAMPEP_0198215222 /NCGR_PEP_ID=MMETSP1445-20131203/47976_1 /TAXON_ID=36898 /ORGANISM="Pyramimonas sp., Strain CCMP2087" /LENGTH=132 /DNA_ID=CAMNT_0043890839 /DNA_START=36 /DNA_END=434 /DNA_ORIENTATION=-
MHCFRGSGYSESESSIQRWSEHSVEEQSGPAFVEMAVRCELARSKRLAAGTAQTTSTSDVSPDLHNLPRRSNLSRASSSSGGFSLSPGVSLLSSPSSAALSELYEAHLKREQTSRRTSFLSRVKRLSLFRKL